MKISQLITGMILLLGGLIMILFSFFQTGEILFVLLFYGIPILIIGVVILFNSKEDKIEQIKKRKGGKK
jgi:hypothetical protein